jgi:hypothetical protein
MLYCTFLYLHILLLRCTVYIKVDIEYQFLFLAICYRQHNFPFQCASARNIKMCSVFISKEKLHIWNNILILYKVPI